MNTVDIYNDNWKSVDFSKPFWLTGVEHAKSNFTYFQLPILVKLKQVNYDKVEEAKKNSLRLNNIWREILFNSKNYEILSDWPKSKVNSFKTNYNSYTPKLFHTREGAQEYFESKLQETYKHLKREADYFLNRIEAIHKQTGVEPLINTEDNG